MAEFEVNISPENRVYAKPRLITDNTMHYCPGCSHGVIHKLVAEVIDEMGLEHDAIGISPRSEERSVGKECGSGWVAYE